ncbi:flagellar protein FlaG [Verticiella sediminum]|uniref:Flagellar protein FlaG n=1 Tax=Verticiella sediminum TaxID=1247510 RepID=A0A556AVD1_9BURK|nr:flagellar protein FlaG [Verticiella sediminum]TSH96902.1 flagellar protein FlaG [Verticiella sediminum]
MSITPVAPLNPLAATPITPAAPSTEAVSTRAVPAVADAVKTGLGDERNLLEQTVEALARSARAWATHLSFSIDDSSGRVVIRVIDSDSGETVREIPPEEALRLARDGGAIKDLAFRTQG